MNCIKLLHKNLILVVLSCCLQLTAIAQLRPQNQSKNLPTRGPIDSTRQQNAGLKPLFKSPQQKVQDRRPPSEVMLEKKKWTWKRMFFQNMTTRFNYYYNAKTKLNKVVKSANRDGQDDYTVLLPFYPFSLQSSSISKGELDSVIEKSSMGIQLHDPRGKWIDDCFLLMGKAYFYENDLDNATKTFKYINITFAPKKKSEYKTVVGANENDQISIATKEKRKGLLAFLKHKKVRNDAFLWQARTLLAMKEYDEVQSLLSVLNADPNFPHRLDGDLAEVRAYSNYIQKRYPETIEPMKLAIEKSSNKVSKARMSFILGQLYVQQQHADSALDAFRHVISLKPDPMMDFQARIQIAKTNAQTTGDIDKSLAGLKHMLRKQKFERYRDGIFYTMGTLVAEKDPAAAVNFMKQSLKQPSDNLMQRALTYKGIADIYYKQRNYPNAKMYYDSTAGVMNKDFRDAALVNTRKEVLSDVVAKLDIIHKQDSLMRIASMEPSERNIYLSKLLAGLKSDSAKKKIKDALNTPTTEEGFASLNNPGGAYAPKEEKGEWYFYNPASKSAGYSEFKRKWGSRTIADNWRRSQNGVMNPTDNSPVTIPEEKQALATTENIPTDSLTVEKLAAGLPLTPEKMTAASTSVKDAWFDLGKLYHDKLEDNPLAIETYDSLLILYPEHPRKPEVIYSLYVWHNKANHSAEAERYKTLVMTKYGNTNFADIIRAGGVKDIDNQKKKEITQVYNDAYTAFKKGNYDEAKALKTKADSTYGINFLQSKFDLLDAMLTIKMDTIAANDSLQLSRKAVQQILNKYAADGEVLAQATALMQALERKAELTNYLAKLDIRRTADGNPILDENVSMRYPWQNPQPVFTDKVNTAKVPADSAKIIAKMTSPLPAPPTPIQPAKPVTPYKLTADNPFFVVLSFQRVSKEQMDEGLNQFARYNANKHAAEKIEVGSFVLTPNDVMLIFRMFPTEDKALAYFDEIRDEAAANIIPRIQRKEYDFFVISRDNFILLNSTKDLTGYRKFFADNYETTQ
ncbi:hypothetical protein DVR12_06230 [Chitinophaga silvatica]|uniref:Tetratricopeptide repeat protein n=1 Tax=Chitinophaga silvatica TaxID=2282649 RepID=A0A3E1YE66_9BACT|nr:hypothetical protein [Chitinophaga silvatica]RFS24788.1 hypothetical protein DVR12_06230 [Chitinophaga silvatica]